MQKMAFKYRVYPTKKQRKYLELCFHWCWWFYRYTLHNFEDDYRIAKAEHQKTMGWYTKNIAYHPCWFDIFDKKNWFEVKADIKNNVFVPVLKNKKREQIVETKPRKRTLPNGEIETYDAVYIRIPWECYQHGGPIKSQMKGERNAYHLVTKAKEIRPVLKELSSTNLSEVIERVESAYNMFFKGIGGFPKYPKERNYNSVSWLNSVNVEKNKVYSLACRLDPVSNTVKLSNFPGLLKIDYHRPIKGTIKRANVSKDILGQYYISFSCVFEESQKQVREGVIGIDMNIKAVDEETRSFITCSNGVKVDIPRWFSLYADKLAKIQKRIASCEDGSPELKKLRRVVKHDLEKIGNKKEYWLHNLTTKLEREYEYVVIEDLELTGFHNKREDPSTATNMELAGDRGQRKAWTETPFGEFKRQLAYKLGDRLIKVDPAYTSKMCSACGNLNDGLTLDQREWDCPTCRVHHDRDINAAINIRRAGRLVILNSRIKNQQENTVSKA